MEVDGRQRRSVVRSERFDDVVVMALREDEGVEALDGAGEVLDVLFETLDAVLEGDLCAGCCAHSCSLPVVPGTLLRIP